MDSETDTGAAAAMPSPEKLLPHRAPFLLVDRILALDPGISARAELSVSGDEFWCAGHFPGYPVMPGVLLVEAMAQVAAIAAGGIGGANTAKFALPLLAGVKSARFVAQARPGMVLTIEARIGRSWGNFGTAAGTVVAENGSRVAECEITFALKELDCDCRDGIIDPRG